MSTRKLRYSERRRLAEEGTLGDYAHEDAPGSFRNALAYLIYEPRFEARTNMITALQEECRLHFGWAGDETPASFALRAPVDDLLDFVEILIDLCTTRTFRRTTGYNQYAATRVLSDVEARVNDLCDRHRFGFRFEAGEAHKIGSPALDTEVVGPTLLAVQRAGWEQVERSFREALDHQRGGETDDALTAAHAAVESALKAVGLSGQFGTMAREFRASDLVPSYLKAIPEALDSLLTLLARSNAIRSSEGDAHGKPPGAPDVPPELAALAIHWAGAFIVYLSEATRR
jgi:hypothetical protein